MIALYPASAYASTSHVSNWETRGARVLCGVTRVWGTAFDPGTQAPLDGYWPGVECSAAGIPQPRHGVGDPFVKLGQGRAGRVRLVDESEDDLTSGSPFVVLAPGSSWGREGITCLVGGRSIRCANSAGHGFLISPRHARLF
jgi:hypothetical protein